MPRRILVSEKEALNFLLPGGGWNVQSAMDIAGANERKKILETGYNEVVINTNAAAYYRFDTVTTDSISTVNDLILMPNEEHRIPIPYDIGEQGTGSSGVVLHVLATATGAGQSCRVVLT